MYVPHRHGCFTVWLYFLIVLGTVGLTGLFLASTLPHRASYQPPSTLIVGLTVGCLIVSMIGTGLLFLLKRWGLYLYVLANVALTGINFAVGLDPVRSLVPLFWVAASIGVMQIGDRSKAWSRLR